MTKRHPRHASRLPIRRLLAAALLAAAASGCSFSYSSDSISDSSKSSSGSSDSSTGDKSQFAGDVVEYTQAYVRAGGSSETFLSGIGDLARDRGITDWESESIAWESIGRGLGRADVGGAAIETYADAWSGSDPGYRAAIERGIDAER